jgi:hypothetical protein
MLLMRLVGILWVMMSICDVGLGRWGFAFAEIVWKKRMVDGRIGGFSPDRWEVLFSVPTHDTSYSAALFGKDTLIYTSLSKSLFCCEVI